MRLVTHIISVSNSYENNHAGVKNGTYMIYYYDEDWKIQTQRINPLLIWYYKLKKYNRKKMYCLNCRLEFTVFSNWYDRDKNPECPYCTESVTDNITVDENENEDSLGKIVSSALIDLATSKLKQYTKTSYD